MLTLPLAEAKTQFSQVMKKVRTGESVTVSYGKKREPIAVIIPFDDWSKLNRKPRKLGVLQGRGSVEFADDWAMTAEELIGEEPVV
ncbi:MAG: type II toxin-antitoxin system prevent-host-death family antitoxin [Coriobacteriia bacterium]|nr:type II toxin-antitoxin system prevent-host-death family antitoxin [Coriobacteriia bacterium]